jgi:hypothetical protein
MVEDKYRAFLTEQLRTHEVRHSGRDFYTHLKGTHDLLRAWSNPDPICLAGLFHSIYGTWHFRHKAFPIENRDVIRGLIGAEAEFLAYLFCVTERPKAFLVHARSPQTAIRDHYTGHLIRLSPAALNKLLEIEAANLLEQGGDIAGLLQHLLGTGISAAAKACIITCMAKAQPRHSAQIGSDHRRRCADDEARTRKCAQ